MSDAAPADSVVCPATEDCPVDEDDGGTSGGGGGGGGGCSRDCPPMWKNDGMCDDACNNPGCNWDGTGIPGESDCTPKNECEKPECWVRMYSDEWNYDDDRARYYDDDDYGDNNYCDEDCERGTPADADPDDDDDDQGGSPAQQFCRAIGLRACPGADLVNGRVQCSFGCDEHTDDNQNDGKLTHTLGHLY